MGWDQCQAKGHQSRHFTSILIYTIWAPSTSLLDCLTVWLTDWCPHQVPSLGLHMVQCRKKYALLATTIVVAKYSKPGLQQGDLFCPYLRLKVS